MDFDVQFVDTHLDLYDRHSSRFAYETVDSFQAAYRHLSNHRRPSTCGLTVRSAHATYRTISEDHTELYDVRQSA